MTPLQVLIDFTKKRIDAERNLVAAQQEALDLVMEGREIQGKYGGQAVTGRERKDNLLAKSNAESSRLGLTNMKSGDVGDLRRRNAEIMAGFSNIEGRRTQQGGRWCRVMDAMAATDPANSELLESTVRPGRTAPLW
jgi:hypothetical protein